MVDQEELQLNAFLVKDMQTNTTFVSVVLEIERLSINVHAVYIMQNQ